MDNMAFHNLFEGWLKQFIKNFDPNCDFEKDVKARYRRWERTWHEDADIFTVRMKRTDEPYKKQEFDHIMDRRWKYMFYGVADVDEKNGKLDIKRRLLIDLRAFAEHIENHPEVLGRARNRTSPYTKYKDFSLKDFPEGMILMSSFKPTFQPALPI